MQEGIPIYFFCSTANIGYCPFLMLSISLGIHLVVLEDLLFWVHDHALLSSSFSSRILNFDLPFYVEKTVNLFLREPCFFTLPFYLPLEIH